MGGDSIDFDIKLKFFLVTKKFNPHYIPKISS